MLVTKPKVNERWLVSCGETEAEQDDYMFAIDDLLEIFTSFVPIDKNRDMHITRWDIDHPMYSNDHMNIYIHTAGSTYWSQTVYQLAHELCHFSINAGVRSTNFNWFEETICEASSHFFLNEMAKLWSQSDNPRKISYHRSFIDYSQDSLKKVEKFPIKDITNDNSNISNYLKSNCEDRRKNRFVTKKMLPIIIKTPSLWKDVPILGNIDELANFSIFLKEWYALASNDSKVAIKKLIHLFE